MPRKLLCMEKIPQIHLEPFGVMAAAINLAEHGLLGVWGIGGSMSKGNWNKY